MSDEEYGYEDDNGGGYDDEGGNNDDGYEPEDNNGQEYDQQEDDYQAEEYYDDEDPPAEEEEEQQHEDDEPQDEDDQDHQEEANDTNEESYDYHNDPTLEEDEAPPATANTNFAEGDDNAEHIPIDFGGMVKGALDGFGGGSIGDIMGTIENITGGSGGLTNIMASGGLAALASNLIANAAHQFLNVNPDTGRIIGSIAGNLIFNMGGQHNSLSDIGKIVLDNIISGKF
uniref:Uncharacterized protein n=1 Tax=Panagrolaimus sp. ES5 TaxID=591445 RepID=A0AC34GI04_9BILA